MKRFARVHGATSTVLMIAVTFVFIVVVAFAPALSQDTPGAKKMDAARRRFLEEDKPGPQATVSGMESCVDCHEARVKSWSASKHAAYVTKVVDKSDDSCEYCHGAASEHVDADDHDKILHFPAMSGVTVRRTTELCVTCHKAVTDKPHWQGNTHAMSGVSCVDCHQFHADDSRPYLLKEAAVHVTNNAAFRYDAKHPTTNQAINGACMNCHTQQQSQARMPSHHPLFEDRVSCTDCHDVHKSTEPNLLPDGKDMSETCFKCHTNKRGPFIFEHEPMRSGGIGDSCMTCHRPHGSPNQKLAVTNGRSMCTQCHSDINQDTNHKSRPGNCWQSGCHGDIHGSNTSSLFFR